MPFFSLSAAKVASTKSTFTSHHSTSSTQLSHTLMPTAPSHSNVDVSNSQQTGLHGSGQINIDSRGHSESGSISYQGAHSGFNLNINNSCTHDFSIGGYIQF